MAAITYTAHARAPLVTDSPAHVAGTQYSIDVKLQAFQTVLNQPKSQHVSLGGVVETTLQRISKIYNIVLIWPHSQNADVEEFLYSIASGETFVFDAFGTVASADAPANVVSVSSDQTIEVLSHGASPWRAVSLTARPVPL